MSADNGIYVAVFPLGNSLEYRVTEGSATSIIESNLTDIDTVRQDEIRLEIFKDAKIFRDRLEALNYAYELSGEYPETEYGVNLITYDRPLEEIPIPVPAPYSERERKYHEILGCLMRELSVFRGRSITDGLDREIEFKINRAVNDAKSLGFGPDLIRTVVNSILNRMT